MSGKPQCQGRRCGGFCLLMNSIGRLLAVANAWMPACAGMTVVVEMG